MSKQLAEVATQWNSGATRESNRGHRAQIPIALTTRPLSHTVIVNVFRVPVLVGARDHITDDDEDVDARLSLNDAGDELTLSGVRRSDASTYSCRAFNSVGAATRTYTLVVQGSDCLQFKLKLKADRYKKHEALATFELRQVSLES